MGKGKIKAIGRLDVRESDLAQSIADGKMEIFALLFTLRITCMKAQKLDYISLLDWLNKNFYRGNKFIYFFKIQHSGSILNMASFIRKQIFNDWKKRPIMGKFKI